ncbi:MAG: winged helix-turn-helix transcriptional regulator, partial [Nitrososphaerota archaeon]
MEGWAIRRDLVLVALLEGPKTLSELSRVTGLSRSELEATLLSLKVAGLVLEQEARGLIRRKTVYSLTEQGRKEAKEARSRIERIAQEVTQKVE